VKRPPRGCETGVLGHQQIVVDSPSSAAILRALSQWSQRTKARDFGEGNKAVFEG
jgi:hypothetical protein